MRTRILMIFAFVTAITVNAQTKKWTLQECVDHAIENNITVKQGENNILIGEQDVKAAKSAFLPSVSGSLSHNLSFGNVELFPGSFVDRTSNSSSIGVGANQLLFNGNRIRNQYEQSKVAQETNELQLNQTIDDISLNVVQSYLNVLFNTENLNAAIQQSEITKKQLSQVKELVDAGVQPVANIADVEATLSNDVQQITIAENNLAISKLTLSQLLQVPFEGFEIAPISVDIPSEALLYDTVDPVLEYAFKNRNEIKIAEKNIESAELATEISKSGFMPQVSLGYNFGTNVFFSNLTSNASFFNQLNDNKGHNFNLRATIPIFSQNQNKTAVARAKIREKNSQLGLEQAKLNLETVIQRAFTDAKAALRTYEAAKVSLEAQELAFKNSQERYSIGTINSFTLEQARIRVFNAQTSLINAKYDFIFRTKILDFYTGKPIGNVN